MNRPVDTSAQPSKLALIGFRYDENSSFMKGAADAPPQIRAAFRSDASNLWSETGLDLGVEGTFFDAGDVEPLAGTDMFSLIEDTVRTLITDNLAPICLGGDHSISYPIIRAVSKKYPELSILHFDAHPDLYDELLGNRHSHASPFARIMEEGLATRLVQVGIRTINGHQREQAERFGVEVIEMRHW
ncbi:MAG: arginase family protein, partial [Pyrinomonadaceae bacterium]|nr:arginase family protein [Pyrinomonadaceae bacterium]